MGHGYSLDGLAGSRDCFYSDEMMLDLLQVDKFGPDCEASGESGAGPLNSAYGCCRSDRAEAKEAGILGNQ